MNSLEQAASKLPAETLGLMRVTGAQMREHIAHPHEQAIQDMLLPDARRMGVMFKVEYDFDNDVWIISWMPEYLMNKKEEKANA